MIQRALDFSAARRSRATDPETSHEAGRAASAFVATHEEAILGALHAHGPATCHELGARLGIDGVAVARRMAKLRDERRVAATNDTRPSPTGRRCTVWKEIR